jgi:hypothetical protein
MFYMMTKKLHYGTILAFAILGFWMPAGPGVAGPLLQTPGTCCPTGLTPYPPAQCQPLVPGGPFPAALQGFMPLPVNCAPIAVAPPLKRPEPSLLVGYLYKDRGAQVTLDYSGGVDRVVRTTKCDVDLQGIWAECAFPIVLTYKADFILSVGHLFPFRNRATQWYGLVEPVDTTRDWHTDMRWWEVTTIWTYHLSGCLSGVAGFRWSSLVIEFDRPENQRGFGSADDSAKLNGNAYIPFIGLLWENHSPQVGRLKAEMIGFPFLPGDFEHTESLSTTSQQAVTKYSPGGEYKTGYFFEATGEYEVCRGGWHFGAFIRFSAAHTERERRVHVNGVLSEADILFDRRDWIFGGKVGFSL